MNRNRQSRRSQNVSFQTIIVGHGPIRRRQLAAEGAALFRPTLAAMQLPQTPDGRLVAATGFDDANPDANGAVAAAALFEAMKSMIDSGASLSPDFHVVGRRPIPKDGWTR